jgi:hypothetical protein
MTDYFYRTEDISPEEVLGFFVPTHQDRGIVGALKNRNPVILVGSRGVGKSFLLRVAQAEMLQEFPTEKIFPVYLSFVRSSLLQTNDPDQFKHWMIARICNAILRALKKSGLVAGVSRNTAILSGSAEPDKEQNTRIEKIADSYENSWLEPNKPVDIAGLPDVEQLKEAIEDLCDELEITRINLLIDEASHILLPEQQRQFFTLFRDLRSHRLTCNAAVYPGVTSFGDTFQPEHDSTIITINRDILSADYVSSMREIVEKQADAATLKEIAKNGKNFAILAYAASGNPRLLLKTLAKSPRVSSSQINETIRQYYRADIWSEHSLLAEKYIGHRPLIDWGRQFLEGTVLPEIKAKNDQYLASDRRTSAYFWIHRDAPAVVKEALRALSYTGVLSEQSSGIKATRAEIGTRYMVNLGCLFSQESVPTTSSFEIAKGLDLRRMTEFGANHSSYKSLLDQNPEIPNKTISIDLEKQLKKNVDVLDLTPWQVTKLIELKLMVVGDVLRAPEETLKKAYYVGDVRARRMRNAAVAAVMEYLSG